MKSHFKYASSSMIDIEDSTDTMNDLFANLDIDLRNNTVVDGIIMETNKHFTLIDVGFKTEGKIDTNEFKVLNEIPETGQKTQVYIVKLENKHGEMILSRLKAKKEIAWDSVVKKYQNNETVLGTLEKPITKEKSQTRGFTVQLDNNIAAFMPESHADSEVLSQLKDTPEGEKTSPIEFKILKLIPNYKNVLVSRKMILQNTDSKEKNKFLETLKTEGSVVTGIIKNITQYGVFVDLKYIDGLLYKSDLSWKKNIHHPYEVIPATQLGKPITVKIIKFDVEKQKVHLGLKQLTDNPWEKLSKSIKIGEEMTLKIVNIKDKEGQIVCYINDYIEAVMPKTEISWNYNEQNAKSSFNIGQEIKVVVYKIDEENERIMISQRKLKDNPWSDFIKANPVKSKVIGKISKMTNNEFIVNIDEHNQLFGYLPFKNLSWDGNGKNLTSDYSIGQSLQLVIQKADEENGKIILSLKHMTEDPLKGVFEKYVTGSEIQFNITRITAQYIYGKEKNGIIVVIPRSEQFWKINEFKSGEQIKAIVQKSERDDNLIVASVKEYQERMKSSLQNNQESKNFLS